MILVIGPRLAGPLAVAVAGLRKWYRAPDAEVRDGLANLEAELRKAAKGGHSATPFDPNDLLAQAERMKPLAVTYEDTGGMLACSPRTVQRLVKSHDLTTIGDGPGTRVVVASVEAYVAREANRMGEAS